VALREGIPTATPDEWQAKVVLGARKISVEQSRGRYVDGGEVELDAWATFASEDLL
jgi:hypothetical protein